MYHHIKTSQKMVLPRKSHLLHQLLAKFDKTSTVCKSEQQEHNYTQRNKKVPPRIWYNIISKFFICVAVHIEENNTGQNLLNVPPFSFCGTHRILIYHKTDLAWWKLYFICKGNCCFYHFHASLYYGYITKYLMIGELSLYNERELSGGTIIPKVTIL